MTLKPKNIYIDIDGVILTRGGMPAEHLHKFLSFILKNYNVYWLSSRCRGDSKYTVDYLSKFVPEQTAVLLEQIKPTNYSLDKTEAIDFSESFFWLDDELFDSEKNTLAKHAEFRSWIEVNLIRNPHQLLHLMYSRLR